MAFANIVESLIDELFQQDRSSTDPVSEPGAGLEEKIEEQIEHIRPELISSGWDEHDFQYFHRLVRPAGTIIRTALNRFIGEELPNIVRIELRRQEQQRLADTAAMEKAKKKREKKTVKKVVAEAPEWQCYRCRVKKVHKREMTKHFQQVHPEEFYAEAYDPNKLISLTLLSKTDADNPVSTDGETGLNNVCG